MDSLLGDGIESLVRSEPEFEVISMEYTGSTAFLQDVARVSPEVIVLSDASPIERSLAAELIHGIPNQATLRVIMIHSDDNTIDVYDQKCVTLTQKEDLFNILRQG